MTKPELNAQHLVFNTTTILSAGAKEVIEAAAAGGYDAISIWPEDLERAAAKGISVEEVRIMLELNGLVVADIDPLLTWSDLVRPKPGQGNFDFAEPDVFFDIAEKLGARSINAVQGFGSSLDLDRAAEDLAALCDRAKEHDLIVTLEFLPWSGVPNAAVGVDLCERTGRANATILFDSWHWFRGGADLEMLRKVPGERIGSTQWNDAPAEPWPSLPEESMQARLSPGEGVIPLVELVRTLDAIGSQAPIGVEVINTRYESMDPKEVGRTTAADIRRVLAEARSHE
ncbi:MAG: sugar phosphate isomerase/epimerase family protein [Myxococcota bacterium]